LAHLGCHCLWLVGPVIGVVLPPLWRQGHKRQSMMCAAASSLGRSRGRPATRRASTSPMDDRGRPDRVRRRRRVIGGPVSTSVFTEKIVKTFLLAFAWEERVKSLRLKCIGSFHRWSGGRGTRRGKGAARPALPPGALSVPTSDIVKARCEPIHHPDCSVGLTQQQRTGIGRERTGVERRHHLAASNRSKSEQIRDTLCRHRGAPRFGEKRLLHSDFR
jgi:hypothetical protein